MDLFKTIFLLITMCIIPIVSGECEFPDDWTGSWFMSARGGPLNITKTEFGGSECIGKGKANRYLVKTTTSEYTCYKCMVINMKHENVIQFKESYCDAQTDDIDFLCQQITGDALLLSIFRLGATPVSCPFHGPLTFTYSKGFVECRDPVSQVDSCADDSRLLFRHQACPDVAGSETYEEELVCLGYWKEGISKYLVGKVNHTHANMDEDRYRCFIFDHPKNNPNDNGSMFWNLAQSADATCQGLNSATEGAKTMQLTKNIPNEKKCKFPGWFTEFTHWHTLDYSQSYYVYHRNSSLRISNGTSAPEDLEVRSQTDVRLVCHSNVDRPRGHDHDNRNHHRDHRQHHDHHGSHHKRNEHSSVTLIVHVTVGCRSGYKCMRIYRRDGHVVQTQSGELAYRPDEACNDHYWNPNVTNFTTLVAQSVQSKACGYMGRFTIPEITSTTNSCGDDQSFTHMVVGCSSHDTMKIHSTCPDDSVHTYRCHGQWENDGITYVVAAPWSRPSGAPRRVCFAYSGGALDTFTLTGRHDNCIARQHDAPLKFNVTRIGNCAEASGQASSATHTHVPSLSLTSYVDVLTLIFTLLLGLL